MKLEKLEIRALSYKSVWIFCFLDLLKFSSNNSVSETLSLLLHNWTRLPYIILVSIQLSTASISITYTWTLMWRYAAYAVLIRSWLSMPICWMKGSLPKWPIRQFRVFKMQKWGGLKCTLAFTLHFVPF